MSFVLTTCLSAGRIGGHKHHAHPTNFVCAFQYSKEAERFYRELPKRLAEFGLKVAEDKTRINRFSRFRPTRTKRFTFLGFEFYWEVDSKGTAWVRRRTSRKKLHAGIQACTDRLKEHRHVRLPKLMGTIRRKVQGHFNYFRAIGNLASLWTFHRDVGKLLYRWLNRRSQRRSLTWEGLNRVLEAYGIPTPTRATAGLRNRGLA